MLNMLNSCPCFPLDILVPVPALGGTVAKTWKDLELLSSWKWAGNVRKLGQMKQLEVTLFDI